jgi:hypothetical protein
MVKDMGNNERKTENVNKTSKKNMNKVYSWFWGRVWVRDVGLNVANIVLRCFGSLRKHAEMPTVPSMLIRIPDENRIV